VGQWVSRVCLDASCLVYLIEAASPFHSEMTALDGEFLPREE
jgi:hypothetical protein